jgi:hypothetical protein
LGTILVGAWLIDSGATCHITGAWELFESFTESDSDVYVELGMGTKHAVKGSGIVPFSMESGGMLRVMDVLWVPKLGGVCSQSQRLRRRDLACSVLGWTNIDQAQMI